MLRVVFLVLFVLASLGEIIASYVHIPVLHQVGKPLIMLSLAAYYAASANRQDQSRTLWLALIFSWMGDVILMLEAMNPSFFMIGLGSFLIVHIMLTITYKNHCYADEDRALHDVQRVRLAFPIVLAGTGLVIILFPVLGSLQIPVLIYAAVLVLMVIQALFRFGRTNNTSFFLVFTGALLFMISDSLLAINKFLQPLPAAIAWIMSSYALAQFFIVQGLLKHDHRLS
jgi:uncharacterized membrane protein YhhN